MSETERKVCRSVFTKKAKAIEELVVSNGDLKIILSKYNSLGEFHEKLQTLNEHVLRKLIENEDTKEEEIEKEMIVASEYNEKYHEVSILIQKIQAADTVDSNSCKSNPSCSNNTKVRLPKIELKKFDGELKNWIGFWSQFSKIHDDDSLKDVDKFEYLYQSMKPDSPAQKLIEGFPPSKENYSKAIEVLKSRYGKEELLIEYYVRELLTLVLKREENLSVTCLYDKLGVQLRALDSLGVTKDKYAAILFPLVESAIPEPVFKVWDRHRVLQNASTKEPENCLLQLLNFLKVEVDGEERLKLRVDKFDQAMTSKQDYKISRSVKPKSNLPSAAVLISSAKPESVVKPNCLFCSKGSHLSHECFSLIDLNLDERLELVKKKGACLRCLRKGHLASKCKLRIKCFVCKGNHLAILCKKNSDKSEECSDGEPVQSTTISVSATENKTTYLQTLTAVLESSSATKKKVRILCDSGSQKSFISEECAKELNIKPKGSVLIQQEVFGGKKTKPRQHKLYNITLQSLNSDYKVNLNVLEQPLICSQVPQMTNQDLINTLKKQNILLTDISTSEDGNDTNIDVLIGADAWATIITSDFLKVSDELVAIRTQLGWTVVGSSQEESTFVSTMFVSTLSSPDLEHFWDLETLGIVDPSEKQEKEDKDARVLEYFEKTVARDADGRYIVKLPWIEDYPPLETNHQVAEKRLQSTTRKLNHMGLLSGYDSVFDEWLDKGIIETVDVENSQMLENVHYLPHRAVVKEGSTTRIRPVFDASNKDVNGYCVNSSLESGPNLIEVIPKVLTNFRKNAFALTADIEKAFLQIVIDPEDRDMLRFLWYKNGEIVTYRHTRVVFGLSCSPFLLGAVLNHHLDHAPTELQPIAQNLKKAFYVDNCLTGVDNECDQNKFITEAQTLLKLGGFNLRGWAGNGYCESPEHVENVLGLKWSCSRDELYCSASSLNLKPTKLTRRTLLSYAQKVFDPIGFTAPTNLVPKMILQKTWSLKLGWDDKLPKELEVEYFKWANQLEYLERCTVTRKIVINSSSTLHVFCDASKNAFGSCIFLRTLTAEDVQVSLVLAKSRVAPVKPVSLPRLELMGAVVGVRLCSLALQCLDYPNIPVLFWLDSSVALAWIAKQGKWSVFVENRVKEINKSTVPSQWRHVPGPANPADLLSRGCTPRQLFNSQWWCGPAWLHKSPDDWPSDKPTPDIEEMEKEKKRSVALLSTVQTSNMAELLGNRISKYSMIVRTIAWMLRFTPENLVTRGYDINAQEFKRAENVLFRLIQNESFSGALTCDVLSGVQKFIDENGIIRLKTRVFNQEDSPEFLYPVILPSNHAVVDRLIEQYHLQNKHAGVQALLVILRERVWILKGRKTIGRIVHKCVICKKFTAQAPQVPLPPLPEERTKTSACFQTTGVDLAGPLFSKDSGKCWVVIFTCAVYRAVHLELVTSLSTDAFVLALRRFIARRGRVEVMYSDNGTNFVGLDKQLKTLNWEKIQNEFNLKSIVWKFNPPASPWWGGFWERLIRILKGLLRRSLGNAFLTFEELNTLICESEGVMNGRPLTYVSENPDDLRPLTPSMFIQSLQGSEVSDLDTLGRTSLKSRWTYLQKVRDDLKARFKREYLSFLKSSKKNRTDTIKVGDIVLVHNEDKRRGMWPLGKVIQLFPGKDDIVRLAKIKTKNGVFLRPIQRLYPLEITTDEEDPVLKVDSTNDKRARTSCEEENVQQQDNNPKTRSGREVRKVDKLNL